MTRVRLLKIDLRPVLVAETEDGHLEEIVCDQVTVSAKDWPAFTGGGLDAAIDKIAAELTAQAAAAGEDAD